MTLPSSASASGLSRTTRPSASTAPSVSTSESNVAMRRGGKLVTQITRRPSRSAFSYQRRTAAEERFVPNAPKSMVSLYEGLRLGEVVDRGHAADPHLDLLELVDRRHVR